MASNEFSPNVPDGHFQDAYLRLAWAKFKIDDLKAAAYRFGEETNIVLERCRDLSRPDTHEIIQLVGREPIPSRIRLMFSDICHSARASLEYLACGLTRANGAAPTRWTGFPFGTDLANFNSLLQSKVPDISAEARDEISAFKPYKGGNDFLYTLHEVNRTDKHLDLVGSVMSLSTLSGIFSVSEEFQMCTELVGTLQSGIPILSLPRDAKFEPKINITVGIITDGIESGPPLPIADLCTAMCDEVGKVLDRVTAVHRP